MRVLSGVHILEASFFKAAYSFNEIIFKFLRLPGFYS